MRPRVRDWQSDLSVVIPAYNEEGGIVPTLEGLRKALPKCEVIVVDDGSRDATLERALSVPGVRVIAHTFNRGYGGALKTGMRHASRRYVAWFDADNEHRVDDLAKMAQKVDDEDLAAVIGRRLSPSVSVVRSFGKFAIRMLVRSLGTDIGKDLNCGLRVFRREIILRYASVLPDQFSASMTSTMVLVERGYKIGFHDIEVNKRIGHSKVKIRDGFSTMVLVLRMVMLFAPMRIFFFPGLLMLLGGLAYGTVRAITTGRGIPVAAALIGMTGMLSAMLGLIADQISQMRLHQLTANAGGHAEELTKPEDPKALPEGSAFLAAPEAERIHAKREEG